MSTIKKQTKKWTTKSGDKIRICDMTDGHLKNTLAFVQRVAKHYQTNQEIALSNMACMFDGDMASLDIDNRLMALEEDGVDPGELCPLYPHLLLEALRRSLEI